MRPHIPQSLIGPHILRSPELHDLSDMPHVPVMRNRMLAVVLAIATLLTVGRVALNSTPGSAQADMPRHTLARA